MAIDLRRRQHSHAQAVAGAFVTGEIIEGPTTLVARAPVAGIRRAVGHLDDGQVDVDPQGVVAEERPEAHERHEEPDLPPAFHVSWDVIPALCINNSSERNFMTENQDFQW